MRKILIFVGLLLVSACASPAQIDQMAVPAAGDVSAIAGDPLYRAVSLGNVDGGERTNPLWTSEVGNAEFAEALRRTLMANDYLNPSGSGPYRLDATLWKVDQPLIGFEFTVDSHVRYRLKEGRTGRAVFEESVAADGVASVGEAVIAVQRLRIANERSIQENLRKLLRVLKAIETPTS